MCSVLFRFTCFTKAVSLRNSHLLMFRCLGARWRTALHALPVFASAHALAAAVAGNKVLLLLLLPLADSWLNIRKMGFSAPWITRSASIACGRSVVCRYSSKLVFPVNSVVFSPTCGLSTRDGVLGTEQCTLYPWLLMACRSLKGSALVLLPAAFGFLRAKDMWINNCMRT